MRHRKEKGRLNRRTSWRKATLKSMMNDLLKYQRIETTMAKAKALRGYVEPLITLAKNSPDSVNAKRRAFRKLCNRDIVKSLFDEVAPLYKDTPGGYTRIMPLGNRRGDGARMVIMELTKRTIPDEKLLRIEEKPPKLKTKKKEKDKTEKPAKPEEKTHAAPEVDIEAKEERAIEDIKKEQAKKEQKKITKKGIFRRFRRKSMG